LLEHIRRQELLRAGDRVGVAVSGGIDSVALLRLLLELRQEIGMVLSVVHFNHKLRGAESDADQEFVANLAREDGLELFVNAGDAAKYAQEEHCGLEAAARELRYEYFYQLLARDQEVERASLPGNAASGPLNPNGETAPPGKATHQLDRLATGHTLDDQAETVLMRVIRGTGLRGLGGIHPRILVEHGNGEGHGEIVRPLLGMRRRELESYLKSLNQNWREDATNLEVKFTRNRVRKVVLPLLEREFNPAVAESLSELAEIARDEEDYWDNEISGWLGTVAQWYQPPLHAAPALSEPQTLVQIQSLRSEQNDSGSPSKQEVRGPANGIFNASVSRPWLLTEPKAVQRRVLKAIGEQAGIPLEFKHIEEILRFAAEEGPDGKVLSLPLGWEMVREREAIEFVKPDRTSEGPSDYEYSLPVPGRVYVPELAATIEVLRVTPESRDAEYNPQQLLRAQLLPQQLKLRNWRAGDKFWPAHTKSPKKVKELLQERHLREPERRLWPVVLSGEEIVWVRGFPVPAKVRAGDHEDATLIREVNVGMEDHEI
jgi:tRNA(Ile)-lysidine synthase